MPQSDSDRPQQESHAFLTEQIVTYLGNKRALLPFIDESVRGIRKRLGGRLLKSADLFSGSGIVARYLKQHCNLLIANDLESYAACVNRCYLTNAETVDRRELEAALRDLRERTAELMPEGGLVSDLYAPADDEHIKPGERVFFTRRNALFLDAARRAIAELPAERRDFFLAPLLYGASVHNNTAGVFKGFYKNRRGIGQFGGENRQALSRITGDIELLLPIFSHFSCECRVEQSDADMLTSHLPQLDLCYLDPPYNQHPYGSNYFMLNLIAEYRRPSEISRVSGIPADWNRSAYNSPARARESLFRLVEQCPSKYLLISYNSEGFISRDELTNHLGKLGRVACRETPYNAFRGSRNLRSRPLRVREYLFILERN